MNISVRWLSYSKHRENANSCRLQQLLVRLTRRSLLYTGVPAVQRFVVTAATFAPFALSFLPLYWHHTRTQLNMLMGL